MFRDELQALNAIHAEQRRTNELLAQLLQSPAAPKKPVSQKQERVKSDESK
ncbi:hypothetical protein [Paenibacillus sp. PDC88]|uniref:hypothetical protein n=1 Tax=Paenibacillus sp. PDC88 TaxID=1884375 RepID=UPI00089BF563|nr:hypothetical protein [Paenibacillus sp. PDC88]SDW30636.1 hypothetical protein SAMN05518848_101950 [Paenibacillus sp. PDC88]